MVYEHTLLISGCCVWLGARRAGPRSFKGRNEDEIGGISDPSPNHMMVMGEYGEVAVAVLRLVTVLVVVVSSCGT
jgi:hypothetical protein